jgi:hypothetical protein
MRARSRQRFLCRKPCLGSRRRQRAGALVALQPRRPDSRNSDRLRRPQRHLRPNERAERPGRRPERRPHRQSSPLAHTLGFVAPSATLDLVIAALVVGYLVAVDATKTIVFDRPTARHGTAHIQRPTSRRLSRFTDRSRAMS